MTGDVQAREAAFIRLRIDLAYDGTAFSGWAKQPGLRTVQGELERAIALILRVEAPQVSLTVAGRTDAGVHARGQVCHIDVRASELERLQGRHTEVSGAARKINGALKRVAASDIVVHDVSVAPDGFDARFSALSRRYEYRVRPRGARRDPLSRAFTAEVGAEIDVAQLRLASQTFLGLQDFTSYCKAREGATAVRTLLEFDWTVEPDGVLAARISADAFCHSMVRALVGAVLKVGEGALTVAELQGITHARTRSSVTPVMPAKGLSLEAIEYPADAELRTRAQATRARREVLEMPGE